MNYQIRRATKADVKSLKALDTVVPHDPTRAEDIDGWLNRDVVLVALLRDQIVAYGVFNHSFFRQGTVELVMVHADYRGMRIGGRLLTKLEEFCDTPKLWVTTNLSNQGMQRLLGRSGFKACGYINGLDPGDPELVYAKRLAQVADGTEVRA